MPSKDISEEVLNRLRFDNKTKGEVLDLVLYHDSLIEPTTKTVKRWLNKIGEHRLSQLIDVRLADIYAHAEGTQESRIKRCNDIKAIMEEVIKQEQCFSIKDLAINGKDIMSFGVPEGKIVGDTLQFILDMVISGDIENTIEAQMEEVKKYLDGKGVLV